MAENDAEYLTLKWGTLKAWSFKSDDARELLREYGEIGQSMSAMAQQDTPRQKEIICALIDVCSAPTIYLDWNGEYVSKADAKRYVMEYRTAKRDLPATGAQVTCE